MLWFLACCSYMFGTLFHSTLRHNHLHVLAVDYDGGDVGQAMSAAYAQLKGPGFFNLVLKTPQEYPTQEDMYHAVWEGKYWASIAANPGASQRLAAAIQGNHSEGAYNPADAFHYVWNQQRYPAFSNSAIGSSMQQLITLIGITWDKRNGTQAAQLLDRTDPTAIQALLNPISATETNIKSAPFGSVILLNTVSMAMPVLQQFFFLLVLNGVVGSHNLYTKMTVFSSLLFRRIAGLIFTFGAALCQAGYFWAFREEWNVNGNQFVLTWMTLWLLMHVHLLVLDTISTVAPFQMMPFVVLLWVFLNLASSLSPLELQDPFYHWAVALPGYNAYTIFITIWTGGSTNRLYRNLPVLFSWWTLGNVLTGLTHIRACHRAYKLHGGKNDSEGGMEKAIEDEQVKADMDPVVESSMSGRTISDTPAADLERYSSLQEAVLEHRAVYGPSVPPFGTGRGIRDV